jgi:hypothetical protein
LVSQWWLDIDAARHSVLDGAPSYGSKNAGWADLLLCDLEQPVGVVEVEGIHDYEGFGQIRIEEYTPLSEVSRLALLIEEHGAVPLPQLLNAICHLALGVRNNWPEPADHLHEYEDSDRQPMAIISHWPVIVLEAKNSSQLRTLRYSAAAAGLKCQAFANTMIGDSAQDQFQKTKAADEKNVDYYALLLFGRSDLLHSLTKKFSLFKESRGQA